MSRTIVAGVLVVAAIATFGDWVWEAIGCHGMTAGVLHGAALLTAVGGALGAASGRLVRGLPIGTLAGTGGALAYYALVAAFGPRAESTAIPAAWVATWLLMALLEGRWLAATRRSWPAIALRGTAAAGLSGLAFYLLLDTLWGAPPIGARDYAIQFVAWAGAWAPGMLALSLGSRRSGQSS